MEKKYIKISIIVGIVALIVIMLVAFGGVAEKLGRLGTVSKNIAISLANASHGDPRSLELMNKEYIKANTGSTSKVDEKELPKALRPFKKHTHPPFTMGACAVCHAPKRSKPAAIITRSVSELCFKCHEPESKIDERMEALDCNKCHSPHHADREELLREKVTEQKCPAGEFIEE